MMTMMTRMVVVLMVMFLGLRFGSVVPDRQDPTLLKMPETLAGTPSLNGGTGGGSSSLDRGRGGAMA
jgi:hypothetical protein